MPRRPTPRIHSRKVPKQGRSGRLVDAILEAAAQILAREGAHRFTTIRVAERAGVSVGSLYQYFPNKEAILFRLQTDEWQRTTDGMSAILDERERPPLERLRRVVQYFIRSECEEAALRLALGDAAPHYRDAPEMAAQRKAGMRRLASFMRELLPDAPAPVRSRTADLLATSLGALGEKVSDERRSERSVQTLATTMADMFCAYLDSLAFVHSHPARVGPATRPANRA